MSASAAVADDGVAQLESIELTPIDVETIDSFHTSLLSGYVDAIGVAARMTNADVRTLLVADGNGWIGARARLRLTPLLAWTVRLLIGLHVRRKLASIAQVYGQLRGTWSIRRGAPEGQWFADALNQAVCVKDSIPAFRTRAALGLLPSLLGLAPKAFGSNAKIATLIALVALFYLVAILGSFVLVSGSAAFAAKRALLLGSSLSPASEPDGEGATGGTGIYALEDLLFAALKRPKRKEALLDAWLLPWYIITLNLAYFVAMLVAVGEGGAALESPWEVVGPATFMCVGVGIGLYRRARERNRPR